MGKVQKEAIEFVKSLERAHQAKKKTSPYLTLEGEPATPEDDRPEGWGQRVNPNCLTCWG